MMPDDSERACEKRIKKNGKTEQKPAIKEIFVKNDEDIKHVRIRDFEDMPWSKTDSSRLPSLLKRLLGN